MALGTRPLDKRIVNPINSSLGIFCKFGISRSKACNAGVMKKFDFWKQNNK